MKTKLISMRVGNGLKNLCVLEETLENMFRALDVEEYADFLDYAINNKSQEIKSIYHPVVQDALLKMQG